jgi:hypothetical protein
MKLYVPELGDQLTLTKNWNFRLFAERRNNDLGEYFNHYLFRYGEWVNKSVVPQIRTADYEVNYPDMNSFESKNIFGLNRYDHQAYDKACREAEQKNPEYVQYHKEYNEWYNQAKNAAVEFIEVELPAGTVLQVDRIYIRKGASDYSSITFFTKNLPETVIENRGWAGTHSKLKKSLRFWVKLPDCNKINFEISEKS